MSKPFCFLMVTHDEWEWEPMYKQWLYKPDKTVLRNRQLGRWYGFLNWKIDNVGFITSVKYVFPETFFRFRYCKNYYKFYPDFEVRYIQTLYPEYQTFMEMTGGKGKMIRSLYHFYPFLQLRVIEGVEYEAIMHNFERIGISFEEELEYEEECR